MKTYRVDVKLFEVKAHHVYQSAIVDASNVGTASKRAWDMIRKVDGVKGKRIKNAVFTVVQIEKK